jgi:hypothetical protein
MIDRRRFVAGAGAAALSAAAPAAAMAAMPRRVLVHCANEADFVGCSLLDGANPTWHEAISEIISADLAELAALEARGVRIVHLRDLLDGAIIRARRAGTWRPWLRRHLAELSGDGGITAATLLGRDAAGRRLWVERPFSLHDGGARQAAILEFATGGAALRPLSAIALAFERA